MNGLSILFSAQKLKNTDIGASVFVWPGAVSLTASSLTLGELLPMCAGEKAMQGERPVSFVQTPPYAKLCVTSSRSAKVDILKSPAFALEASPTQATRKPPA